MNYLIDFFYFFFVFHISQNTVTSVQLCILVSFVCPNVEGGYAYRGSVLEKSLEVLILKRARYKCLFCSRTSNTPAWPSSQLEVHVSSGGQRGTEKAFQLVYKRRASTCRPSDTLLQIYLEGQMRIIKRILTFPF